jgi:hypothetical protein
VAVAVVVVVVVVGVVVLPAATTESGDPTNFDGGLPPVVNMASHLCKSSFARRSKSSSSFEDEEVREDELEAVEAAEEMEVAAIEEEELTSSLLLSGMFVCRLRSAATASNPLPLAVASLLSATTEVVVVLATIACLF